MFVDRVGQEYGKGPAGEPFSAPGLGVTLATGGSSLCLAPGLVWLKDWLSPTLCSEPLLVASPRGTGISGMAYRESSSEEASGKRVSQENQAEATWPFVI